MSQSKSDLISHICCHFKGGRGGTIINIWTKIPVGISNSGIILKKKNLKNKKKSFLS